jgi:hypothetical protein
VANLSKIPPDGGKFANIVIDTGGKYWEQYQNAFPLLSELEGKNLSLCYLYCHIVV